MRGIFRIRDQEEAVIETAKEIVRDVVAPSAKEVDEHARFPENGLAALRERGLFGLAVPTSEGGLGFGPRVFAAVTEELATACGTTAMVYVMHVTATAAIASSTTLTERKSLLADIAKGKHLTTLAFSEKGSRSHFWAPVSKLEPDGDQGFRTNAYKSWVTGARHADSYVSSSLVPNPASALDSVVYLLRRTDAGVKVLSGFDGLGLRGNDSAPVQYEDVRAPKGALVSALSEGSKTMLEVVLPWFVIGTSAMATGLCRAAVDATATHLGGAKLEHLGSSLRDIQVLRARLAEMAVHTDQARCLLGHTAAELEAPQADAPLWVLKTRLAALEAAVSVTDLAMKACGGAAYSKHLAVERIFRDARAGWVMAPTVDHLGDFIGKALLGMPLF